MDIIRNILDDNYLIKELMAAKLNGKGVLLSHYEVCLILSYALAGAAMELVKHEIDFNEEYRVKKN
ncbi:MAG: hypothetical protein ACRCX2_01790 [Paraclostridium sp.]